MSKKVLVLNRPQNLPLNRPLEFVEKNNLFHFNLRVYVKLNYRWHTCCYFWKIAFSVFSGALSWLFLSFLLLPIWLNIWLSLKNQVKYRLETAGNHPTFFRNSNKSNRWFKKGHYFLVNYECISRSLWTVLGIHS